jgi:periodic tryptophan protein 2
MMYAGTHGGGKRAVLRCRALALAPSGNTWAAATPEGILLFSLSSAALFDPTDLTEEVSVPSVHSLLGSGQTVRAIHVASRLHSPALVAHCLFSVPIERVPVLAAQLPPPAVLPALRALADAMSSSPHLAFMLRWERSLLEHHGDQLQAMPQSTVMPALRALQQSMRNAVERLAPTVEDCMYKLAYLEVQSRLQEGAKGDNGVQELPA